VIERRREAERIVARFTAAATTVGAMAVPSATLAIVAIDAAMLASLSETFGVRVSFATISASLGITGTANAIGRSIFVEAARALGWGAGPLGIAGVAALGATTAGLQTWVLGRLAIAVCEHGGERIPSVMTRDLVRDAKEAFAEVHR